MEKMLESKFVEKVIEFNNLAGNTGELNNKLVSLYIGLIAEEFAELLEASNGEAHLINIIKTASTNYKKYEGEYRVSLDNALLNKDNRIEILDGCVDIAVVSLGCGIANGCEIIGACEEVANNNLEKFPIIDGERVVLKDENGKIKKPSNYQSVNLEKFVK